MQIVLKGLSAQWETEQDKNNNSADAGEDSAVGHARHRGERDES